VLIQPRAPSLLRGVSVGSLEVDKSAVMARRLIGCWLPGITGQNLAMGGFSPLARDTSAVTGSTFEGVGLSSQGANTGMTGFATSPFKDWSTGFSIFWRGNAIGAPITGNSSYGAIEYDNAVTSPYVVVGLYNEGSAGNATVNTFWNVSGNFLAGTGVSLASGMNSLGGVFVIDGNNRIFVNGLLRSTDVWNNGFSGAPLSTSTSTISIGTFTAVQSRAVNAISNIVMMWARILTAGEMAALHADPYQLVSGTENIEPWWFDAVAAGGGGGKLFIPSSLSGLGAGGPFFHDRLTS
jgi:hypothetical protein